MNQDIFIRKEGKVGRITLQRPKALNALTYEMCLAIENAMVQWLEESNVELVMIDAEGDRAFCAGGDVAKLYTNSKDGNLDYGREFWSDEYRLNAFIANYPIPYIAIMDGIVMGGGVGISAHGSDRIVTERSMIAMPECAIGLVPDVGGNYILANAPGHIGEYLSITGYRMGPGDAVLAGFADVQVASSDIKALKAKLCETADLAVIANYGSPPDIPALNEHQEKIEKHFSKASAIDCLQSLEAEEDEWSKKTASLIRRACPLSVACAYDLVRLVREKSSIEEALELEHRFTYRSISHGEMIEGIRAQVIDKDKAPKWKTPTLEEVTQTQIDSMLAPLEKTNANIRLTKQPQRMKETI